MFYNESELIFTFARSDGPGGQNVNKVNTKVTLRWNILSSINCREDVKERFSKRFKLTNEGEIVIVSTRFRSQLRNKSDCIEKLSKMLEEVKDPPKRRKKTRPTYSSVRKRLESKKLQSNKKKGRNNKNWD